METQILGLPELAAKWKMPLSLVHHYKREGQLPPAEFKAGKRLFWLPETINAAKCPHPGKRGRKTGKAKDADE